MLAGEINITLLIVEGDSLHSAIEEDSIGVIVLGGQIAVSAVDAGDEDEVVHALHQINTDQVAVLV